MSARLVQTVYYAIFFSYWLLRYTRADFKIFPEHQLFYENVHDCSGSHGYFNISTLKVSRVNRTTLGMRGSVILYKNIPNNTMVKLKIQILKNGHWVDNLFELKPTNLCQFMKEDQSFYPKLVQNSNLPTSCPLMKGEFVFSNGNLKFGNLPPYLPPGCWKIMTQLLYKNRAIACFHVALKITGPNGSANPRCT